MYKKEDDHSKILKRNDQNGPIVVHWDQREKASVQEEFREAQCGRNLPVGWVLCRVYSENISGYYKPVLIKKRLNVIECMRNGCLLIIHNFLLYCNVVYQIMLINFV